LACGFPESIHGQQLQLMCTRIRFPKNKDKSQRQRSTFYKHVYLSIAQRRHITFRICACISLSTQNRTPRLP
jgi:hypothetical protein